MSKEIRNEFEKAALNQRSAGMLNDFWHFARENKKWWLLPIIGILLLFSMLLVLGSTAMAPFIYTLF